VVATGDRILEVGQVRGEALRIQAQVIAGGDDDIAAERAVDPVNGVGEIVPPRLGVGVGPQQGNELVATHPALARHGEQRQEGQASSLDSATGERAALRRNRQSAEDDESLHGQNRRVARLGRERGDPFASF
jgi:hypothetical protein